MEQMLKFKQLFNSKFYDATNKTKKSIFKRSILRRNYNWLLFASFEDNTPLIFLNIKTLIIACFFATGGFAQTFNYQAAVRDASGALVINQSIGVQVRVLEGSASGNEVFNETHTVTSNAYGIISLPVGGGTMNGTFTSFESIDWSQSTKWIEISADISGGTSYSLLGASELRSVPHAFHANHSTTADNAGVFLNTVNVTSNENGDYLTDDFVFGSFQLSSNGVNSIYNRRMFFDKSKGAFRVGFSRDDEWNDAKVGNYSVAMGYGGVASGESSFAMGSNANALGIRSFAFGLNAGAFEDYSIGLGDNSTANGTGSVAIGRGANAGSFGETSLGQFNTYITETTDSFVATDRLFVIGNGTDPNIGGSRSDALVMLKNGNTTLNGQLTIDGDNQGAGTPYSLPAQDGTLNQIMSTDGGGNLAWVTPAASVIPNGGTNGQLLGTDGTDLQWVTPVDNVDDLDADPTNEIELPTGGNSGQVLSTDGSGVYNWVNQSNSGAFTTTANVTSNAPGTIATDDFVFGSTTLNNNMGTGDDNARMFFDKSNFAFRAGLTSSDQWDSHKIGTGSVGLGGDSEASGFYSIAIGATTISSGFESVVIGGSSTASNTSSVALGSSVTSQGIGSVGLGFQLTSESLGQISIGRLNTGVAGDPNNYVSTDRLFVIGNGATAASDALVMLKNGNTRLNGALTIDGDNQGVGDSYTLPAQDGTANQVITTDGSGVTSWTSISSGGTTLPSGGTAGQLLATDGSGNYSWVTDNVDDADTDATNEIELPVQTGQSGKMLSTDGTSPSWVDAPATLPSQSGQSGKILSTDGTNASWIADAVNDSDSDPTNEIELPAQTGQSGKILSTDGTSPSWVDTPNGLPEGGTSGQLLATDGSGNYTWVTDAVDDADTDATNEIELPTGGTNGQVLQTNGSGMYNWVNQASSGVFSTTANVTSNASGTGTDDFVFGSTTLNDNSAISTDDSRFFFDKSKAAFRAGYAPGTKWDEANVGANSTAFGWQTTASGDSGFASGGSTTAAAPFSTAMGLGSNASGNEATSLGYYTTAESYGQTTIGITNTIVTGSPNTFVSTDRLFVIGNGDTTRRDALVMLKNGNTTLNGELTTDEVITDGIKVNALPTFLGNQNGTAFTSAGWTEVGSYEVSNPSKTNLHDNGNHFNETNGRFVAPVDGFYQFSAQVRLDGVSSGYSRVLISLNGSTNASSGLHSIRNADTAIGSWDSQSVSGTMKLSAGDEVSVFVYSSADTTYAISPESSFSGHLISKF